MILKELLLEHFPDLLLLQDALVLYGRLQISLTRGADDESILIEQLLDVLYKELDQSSIFSVGVPWSVFPYSLDLSLFVIFHLR